MGHGVDGFLLVDVYAVAHSGGRLVPFTPDFILEIVEKFEHERDASSTLPHPPALWVGHTFNGVYGTVQGEGAWYRSNDDTIYYLSDSSSVPHIHSACDFLRSDGYENGVAWMPQNHVLDSAIVMLEVVDSPLVASRTPSPSRHRKVTLPVLDIRSNWALTMVKTSPRWLSSWVFRKKVVVIDSRITDALTKGAAGKLPSAYLWRQLNSEAASRLMNDPEFNLVEERWPGVLPTVVSNCAWYVFLRDPSDMSLQVVHHTYGKKFRAQHAALKDIAEPAEGVWDDQPLTRKAAVVAKIAIGLGVGLLATYYLYKYKDALFPPRQPEPLPLWKRLWQAFFPSAPQNTAVVGSLLRAVVPQERGPWYTWNPFKRPEPVPLKWYERLWRTTPAPPPSAVNRLVEGLRKFLEELGNAVGTASRAALTLMYQPIGLCLLSPVIEEVAKRSFPPLGHSIPWVEFGLKMLTAYKDGTLDSTTVGLGAATVGMHYMAWSFPLTEGVLLHAAWNTSAVFAGFGRPPGSNVATLGAGSLAATAALWKQKRDFWNGIQESHEWRDFREQFYLTPWTFRNVNCELPPGSYPIPTHSLMSFVPAQVESHAKIPDQDSQMVISQKFRLPLQESLLGYFVYLPTNVPMYQPAKTDRNLWFVIQARLTCKPPMDPLLQEVAWDAWCVESSLDRLVPQHMKMSWGNVSPAWRAHVYQDGTPFQKGKLRREKAYAATMGLPGLTESCFSVAEVMVKTDEVLMKRGEMKPRAIVNVSPRAQLLLGPYVYEATQLLKAIWKPHHFDKPTLFLRNPKGELFPVYVTFGAGLLDEDLDLWLEEAMSRPAQESVFIIVAGDDSYVVHNVNGETRFYEGDASMYDQSQSFGPLKAEFYLLHRLGVPTRIIDGLFRVCQATYVIKGRDDEQNKTKIKHTHRPMRATGAIDTTFGNSVVMAMAWVAVLEYSPDDLEAGFRRLGLDMKFRFHKDPMDGSFLKGAWYLYEGKLTWGPLPSRILKMGKTTSNPLLLYRGCSFSTACAYFASDLASSFEPFLLTPCIRAFVATYKIEGRKSMYPLKKLFEGLYSIKPKGLKGRVVTDLESTCRRYSITERDISEMEELISTGLHRFIVHPGFEALADRDYR